MSKATIIAVVIVVLLIAGAWFYANYASSALNKMLGGKGSTREGYPPSNHALQYATLGTFSSQPLFEPDVLRKCSDGAYMYTDNPQMMSFCSSMPTCALKSSSCGCGLMGRPPYHVGYTHPSCVNCDQPQCGSSCNNYALAGGGCGGMAPAMGTPAMVIPGANGRNAVPGTPAMVIPGANGRNGSNEIPGTPAMVIPGANGRNGSNEIPGTPAMVLPGYKNINSVMGTLALTLPGGCNNGCMPQGLGSCGAGGMMGGACGQSTCDRKLFVPALSKM